MGVVWRNGNKNVFRWVLFRLSLGSHPNQKAVQMMVHCVVICLVVFLSTSCTTADVVDSSISPSTDPSVSTDTTLLPSGQTSTLQESSPSTPIEDSGKTTSAEESGAGDGSRSESGRLSAEVRDRLMEAIATDLAQSKESISLESVTAQTWSNGCLGLATKDEFCTMALVDGWQIEVRTGESRTIYRSNESGTVVRRAN